MNQENTLDPEIMLAGKLNSECKGENAWQTPAGLYSTASDDPLALNNFQVIAGAAPSFNNWRDLDRLLQTITHVAAGFDSNFMEEPLIALGAKHGNCCGAAIDDDSCAIAVRKMLDGDLQAIFGGLVMLNFDVDVIIAEILLTHKMPEGARRLLDGIIAPRFSPEAVEMLRRRGDRCRFIVNPKLGDLSLDSLDMAKRFSYGRGVIIVQQNYEFVFELDDPELQSFGNSLTVDQETDMVLAWAVGSTSNSNTITLVRDGALIGNGVGQQDRVTGCRLAVSRAKQAGHETAGGVAYSDSFFPFIDGPEVLAAEGIVAILATSGSVKDQEVKDFCVTQNISLCLLPDTKARGFFGH